MGRKRPKQKKTKQQPTQPAAAETQTATQTEPIESPANPRRSFLAALVGTVVGVAPVLAGLAVFLDPLGKKKSSGNWVRVASLDAVPTDGRPVRFPVIAKRTDAWSAYPPEPIGSVYLRRTAEGDTPVAHTTVCPHLGCSVDYRPAQDCFLCPCHNSEFTVEGARTDPEESPSPRDMDTVEVKIENGHVLVDYRNFKGGVEAKVEE